MFQSKVGFEGNLKAKKIAAPKAPLSWRIRNWARFEFIWGFLGFYIAALVSKYFGAVTFRPRLKARLIKADGTVIDYGTIGIGRLVTTAFVNDMVDELIAETTAWGDYKFHDSGVGTTAAAIGDTDIETTDGESRQAGTQVEAAANIYRSVGTIAYTTTKAITEHGLLNIVTGGILMDRHVFSAINVDNGDSIQFTYELTCTAGG
jgi:hypothetical protein